MIKYVFGLLTFNKNLNQYSKLRPIQSSILEMHEFSFYN